MRARRVARWTWRLIRDYGDVAIALVVAGSLSVWALLNTGAEADPVEVAAWTLVVLTVISWALLRDRIARVQSPEADTWISRDQAEDTPRLQQLLEQFPRYEAADFLEYSCNHAWPLVNRAVKDAGCQIRILLRHPEGQGSAQKRWIEGSLMRLKRDYLDVHPGRIEVRCYREPASLRGRRFEPYVINVGWYTPYVDNEDQVLGHKNPLITARLTSEEGLKLSRMFAGLFNALWHSPSTASAEEVLRDMGG